MVALAERTVQVTKFTENRFLCSVCKRNNNFELVVKQDGSNYYLGEKCPKCDHYEDFKEISRREAAKYLILDDLQ